jgi:cyclic pyranopterin phosphate synthase
MPEKKLELAVIKRTIDDIKSLDIPRVHFYGGEPLLHSDVVEMIAYASKNNVTSSLGTNGVMLRKNKVDELYSAGLRHVSIGIYGVGKNYNNYVGRSDRFEQLEENVKYIRHSYPDMWLSFCWLLMKPTCDLNSLHEILNFSKQHAVPFYVTLVHYDFPYFCEGDNGELQFYDEDRDSINILVEELLHLKQQFPSLISNTPQGINSISDWLIKKEKMKIPCHTYGSLWIGPNGVVRVCQKSKDLGNVNDSRLKDVIYTDAHNESAQNCYRLNCSNCHFWYDDRINRHSESRKRYSSWGRVKVGIDEFQRQDAVPNVRSRHLPEPRP